MIWRLKIVLRGAYSTEYCKLKTSHPSEPSSTFFAVNLAKIYSYIFDTFLAFKLVIWLILGKDCDIASDKYRYNVC